MNNLRILHVSLCLDSSLRGLAWGLRGTQCIWESADKDKEITPFFTENWPFGAAVKKTIASTEKFISIVDVL